MSTTKPHRRLVIDTRIVIELPDDRAPTDYVRAAHNYLSDHAGHAISAWPAGRDVLIKVAQTSYEEAGQGDGITIDELRPQEVRPILQGSLL